MSSALVIFSGGQDSTTCLFWARQHFDKVGAVTFDYGQRHHVEVDAARRIAELAKVDLEVTDLGLVFKGSSPLTNPSQAVEQYDSPSHLPGGLENTFVPGRNILFLSVAANRAWVGGYRTLVMGVGQEDYGGYPDCRQDFISKMQAALSSGLDSPLDILTPLMHLSKRQTVELAATLPGCLDALALSHTCYQGTRPPCMACHACLLRQRGFDEAGMTDPLLAACR
ncbi:MAG TPA: 7-cyano-7-deazaguanine synthase QueC [Candidatus Xenobia bacterium]|jgi:7-cyano-7-deazaguanine synthase